MTKVFSIIISVIFSDPEDAINSKAELRSVQEAAKVAGKEVESAIIDKIPYNKVCSLVVGRKEINQSPTSE